jgi:hypothetical protein
MSDALAHARATAPDDPIGEAIGEVIAARHSIVEVLQRTQTRLEIVERRNLELEKLNLENKLRWYTEEQLAQRIGCSVDTLARLRQRKKIPYAKFGARVFRYSSLDEVEIAKLLRVKPGPVLAKAPRRQAERAA